MNEQTNYFPLFLMGIILIIAGLLVGIFPKLLMRYNSFSCDKEEVDWKGAGRLARRCLLAGGISQLLGAAVFIKWGLEELVIVFDVVVVMLVVIVNFVKSRKYNL